MRESQIMVTHILQIHFRQIRKNWVLAYFETAQMNEHAFDRDGKPFSLIYSC